jgi:hypothetical protein
MDDLHAWLTRQIEEHLVEPNSRLGEAIKDRKRGPCRRRVPEPHLHLRTLRSQSVRLPDGVAATRRGGRRQARLLDAVELPGRAGPRPRHQQNARRGPFRRSSPNNSTTTPSFIPSARCWTISRRSSPISVAVPGSVQRPPLSPRRPRPTPSSNEHSTSSSPSPCRQNPRTQFEDKPQETRQDFVFQQRNFRS